MLTENKTEAEEQADEAVHRINELAPKLKNIEDHARRFSDNADRVLPEAGPLESAKSYREKKAMPIYERIVKVLRGLYNKYLDLKHSFEQLQQKYKSLESSFSRQAKENNELKSVAKNYRTLCRGYGEEEIAARVRAIQEKEASEKRHNRRQYNYDIR